MSLRRVLLCLLLVLGPGACAAQDRRSIVWQGVERHYVVYHPPKGSAPAPLVVALSGQGQDLRTFRDWLPLEPVADRNGFVVAYPEAIGGSWSYWPGARVTLPGRPSEEADDIGFVAAVVEALVKDGTADPARVYLTGISRGALMTWTMACQRSSLFAGVAPLSGAMTTWHVENCHPSRPLPVVAVDGTDDPVLHYDGFINVPPIPRLLSVAESLFFWWHLSGCTRETLTTLPHLDLEDPTRIEVDRWLDCRTGPPVTLFRVDGGGHAPPLTANKPSPRNVGARNRDIDTAQVIWDFLSTGGHGPGGGR